MKKVLSTALLLCIFFTSSRGQQNACAEAIEMQIKTWPAKANLLMDSGQIKNDAGRYEILYGTNASHKELQYVFAKAWNNTDPEPQLVEIFFRDGKPLKLVYTRKHTAGGGMEEKETTHFYFYGSDCEIPEENQYSYQKNFEFFSQMAGSYQAAFLNKFAGR